MRAIRSLRVTAAALIPLLTLACTGDFGDAPDAGPTGYPGLFAQTGQFPTMQASDGPFARDVDQASLGSTGSIENDADDPADPDGVPNLGPVNTDSDDGIGSMVIFLVSIPPPAVMTVNVTGDPNGTGGQYWINVAIDLNMDGDWEDVLAPGLIEWVVRNFPVVVTPGVTLPVRLPPFLFGNGNRLPDGAWMRILLSNERLTGPAWTGGGGGFAAGEVEDHVINLPRVAGKSCAIQMACPNTVWFPRGSPIGAQVNFGCAINNLGADQCRARYSMTQVTPGAAVVETPPPPCMPNGPLRLRCGPTRLIPAPLPLNFTATKVGALPSQWTYRAWAFDPPSVVTPEGVILGFGDSVGDVLFNDLPAEEFTAYTELGEGYVSLRIPSSLEGIEGEERAIVYPGGSFGGYTYDALVSHGAGPISIAP